jgi:hypothetical protein
MAWRVDCSWGSGLEMIRSVRVCLLLLVKKFEDEWAAASGLRPTLRPTPSCRPDEYL